jgi:cytochrome c oxidase subunit III
MPDTLPAFQFTDRDHQHDVAALGMWVFLASEVLFFGALILAYCVYRIDDSAGFIAAARHTKIGIGAANTAILLTSSFAVAWATTAARLGDRLKTAILLGMAALLGLAFLGLKALEYRMEFDERFVPGLNFAFTGTEAHAAFQFFSIYFVATGLHAVHVAIGIVALGVIAWRANQDAYSERYHAPVTVAGLYWHFVDLVWIFLFALLYLPGRSG